MAGGLLVLFLGMYSWNQRTHTLDDIAANVGLEMSGTVLGTFDSVKGSVMDAWRRYVDLVGVREENERLRAQVAELQARIVSHGEDLAELARLRELVQLPVDSAWKPVGARILAGRMGPNAIQDSITINRGYTSGARPGTPIVTNMGLVGRVLRASPHAATVLLITDPGSRIAAHIMVVHEIRSCRDIQSSFLCSGHFQGVARSLHFAVRHDLHTAFRPQRGLHPFLVTALAKDGQLAAFCLHLMGQRSFIADAESQGTRLAGLHSHDDHAVGERSESRAGIVHPIHFIACGGRGIDHHICRPGVFFCHPAGGGTFKAFTCAGA